MKPPPELVLINGRFFRQAVTGVQRYAREMVAALSRLRDARYEFLVAVPGAGPLEPLGGLRTLQDPSFLPDALWQQVRLPWLMKKVRASLLWSPCNIGPLWARRHVVTIHDASVLARPGWFSREFRSYYKACWRVLGRTAGAVATVSEFSKRELVAHSIGTEGRVRVVPGGVGSMFSPGRREPLGFPYVLSVGSRDPRKNLARLFQAWERLPASVKAGRRLVVAGGAARSFAPDVPEGRRDGISFLGRVPDHRLPSLYAGADAFVFPSLYEGFGLPPLEAMACGCPVVASFAASLPEVCGDAALPVDPLSVDSIAAGIRKVLTDEALRKDLIRKGLERARMFDWESSAKRLLEVFDGIAKG